MGIFKTQHIYKKKFSTWPREMTQWLKMATALPEDWNSVPRTPGWWPTTACISISKGWTPSSASQCNTGGDTL